MATNLNGSDYSFWNKDEKNTNVKRSGFSLSFTHGYTQNEGEVRPFYEEYMLPNSMLRVSNKFVMWQSPLATRNFTNQKVYTHYFAQSVKHMWHAYRQQQFGGRYQDYDTPELHFNTVTVENSAPSTVQSTGDPSKMGYKSTDNANPLINAIRGLDKDSAYTVSSMEPTSKDLANWRSCFYETGSLMDSFGFQTDTILPESVCPNPWLNWLYLGAYRQFFMNKVLWRGDSSDPSNGMRKVWFPDDEEDFSFKVGSGNKDTGLVGRFWSPKYRSGIELQGFEKVSGSGVYEACLKFVFTRYDSIAPSNTTIAFSLQNTTLTFGATVINIKPLLDEITGDNISITANILNLFTTYETVFKAKWSYLVSSIRKLILEKLNVIDLFEIRYRNFKNDYFTSGLPSPLIGGDSTKPRININLDSANGSIDFTDSFLHKEEGTSPYGHAYTHLSIGKNSQMSDPTKLYGAQGAEDSDFSVTVTDDIVEALNRAKISLTAPDSMGITADNIRLLNDTTLYLEALARSDGDYASMVRAIYGVTPNELDTKPFYVGGSVTHVVTQDVVQTSPENSSADTILGSVTQRGSSSNGSKIGQITAKDSMIVIGVMSVIPDTVYCQGVSRKWTARDKLDRPNPFFTGIQMQAIQNYELYVSGDETVDTEPFIYQGAWDFMRYRSNRVSGLLKPKYVSGVLQNKPFSQMTQVRYFDSTPSMNMDFVSTKFNISHEHLAVVDTDLTPEFTVLIANNVEGVLPLPYYAIPQRV